MSKGQTGSFYSRIQDLPAYQKIILVLTVLVGFYLLGWFLLAPSTQVAEEPEDTGTVIQQSETVSPSTEAKPVDHDELDRNKSTVPSIDGKEIPSVENTVNISVKEARKAMDVARSGIKEYTTWGEKETLNSREKRLNKYFDSKSISKGLSPSGSNPIESEYLSEQKHPKYVYYSEIQSVQAVGGDTKRFRVSVSAKIRFADLNKEGKIDSVIREQYPNYVVDLSKQKGEWKILEVVNNGQ